MGKGKKSKDDEEILSQIFDFIFAQLKEKPAKRKPLKRGGPASSSVMADAVAAALEKPGLFVNEHIIESMNDALTIELGRMNAMEDGSAKAKITTTNLVDFIRDPDKVLSKPKQAAQEIRKSRRVEAFGKSMQALAAYAWAKKYNLDLDTRKALVGYYEAQGRGTEAEAGHALANISGGKSLMMQNSDKTYQWNRSAELIGRGVYGEVVWASLSDADKSRFRKAVLLKGDGLNTTELANYKNIAMAISGGNSNKIDINENDQYIALENYNIDQRINELQQQLATNPNNNPDKVKEGITRLEEAKIIISGHLDKSTNLVAAQQELVVRIRDAKRNLNAARQANDRALMSQYQKEIKRLQEGSRTLNSMSFWGKVGSVEGVYNSWKDIYGGVAGENVVLSIVNGSFFDKDSNRIFCPSEGVKITLNSHEKHKPGSSNPLDRVDKDEQIKIYVAAKGSNPLINGYNNIMTNLYYLTPKSILKSLFVNGEGFVYLAYRKQLGMMSRNGGKVIDFKLLLKNDPTYISGLITNGISLSEISELQKVAKTAKFFTFFQRQRDTVNDWLNDNVYRKLREKIGNFLIDKVRGEGADLLLSQWIEKGGFEVLAKTLVTTVLDGLGIAATGGLGSVIVPILTAFVSDILYDIAKVLIEIVLLLAGGILGLAVFGGDAAVRNFNKTTYAYTNETPGEVVINPNFKGTSPIIGTDDTTDTNGHDLANFVGGTLPDGQKCLLGGSSAPHCSQGPYGSFSHKNVAAIDVTGVDYFYAPDFCGNENCTVTFSGPAYCSLGYAGGEVKFTATYQGNTYEFLLIHVSSIYGVGTKLSAGQRVARVMTTTETTTACSTGMHIHIQARMNGTVVNPRDVLNSETSKGGFGCNISVCDP